MMNIVLRTCSLNLLSAIIYNCFSSSKYLSQTQTTMSDGLNLSLSCRRNKQKPKMEDRWQLCPIALMRGADRETAKVKDRLGANGRYRLKKSLERPHEMHPRWSGWLQRKEDSQPKQYYFWQWIIRLARRPAMIFTVIHFTQVLFFSPAFLGLSMKTGRTDQFGDSLQQK